ncbi:MAG TPA: peptidylprolyl isomerase [Candidatus Tetragenococcus pullicola]|nr:peptidylprolyl isomerase [Candidatus Tetragenococcus pullicola]
MKKKLILTLASILGVFTLAACSNDTDNEIASMKGGKITVSDFYEEAKTDQNSQQIVFNMILTRVFTNKYGDEIDGKEVNAKIKELFGEDYKDQLEAAGMTEKDLKKNVKDSLAFQEGLKSHVDLSKDDLKTAWESFHPEVEAQLIVATTEDDANDLLEKVKAEDADFGEIAKDNSASATAEEDGSVTFDSASTDVPAEVMAAAWDMENDDISDVIPVASQYGSSFYIVKMVKSQDKGNDMSKYQDEVEELATNTKLNDQTFTTEAIGEELKEANVKIKDEAFTNLLADYIGEDETSTDSSATEQTDASTEEDSETEESTTESTK